MSMCCTASEPLTLLCFDEVFFFFSSRRRHTRCLSDWSSDVCSSDLHSAFGSGVVVDKQGEPLGFAIIAQDNSGPKYAECVCQAGGCAQKASDRCKEVRKIGRASCRERVEISVVGVSVNKKRAKNRET